MGSTTIPPTAEYQHVRVFLEYASALSLQVWPALPSSHTLNAPGLSRFENGHAKAKPSTHMMASAFDIPSRQLAPEPAKGVFAALLHQHGWLFRS